MPLQRRKPKKYKYIIWAIIIMIVILMIVSFTPQPEFTETILYP